MEEEYKIEEIVNKEIIYNFLDILTSTLFTNEHSEISTIPINHGQNAGFTLSHLIKDNYHFKTEGEYLILEKDGKEIGKCFNGLGLFDWMIGTAIYLKDKNLIEDFKKYFMF